MKEEKEADLTRPKKQVPSSLPLNQRQSKDQVERDGLPMASPPPLSISFPSSSKLAYSSRLPSIASLTTDDPKGEGKGKGKEKQKEIQNDHQDLLATRTVSDSTSHSSTPIRERSRANSTPSDLSDLSKLTSTSVLPEPPPTTPLTATSNPSSSTPLPRSTRLRRTPGTSSFGSTTSSSSNSSNPSTLTPIPNRGSNLVQSSFTTSAVESSVGIPDAALSSAVEFTPPFTSNNNGDFIYAEVAARGTEQNGTGQSAEREVEPPPYQETQSTSNQALNPDRQADLPEHSESRSKSQPPKNSESSKSRNSRGGGHKRGETENENAAEESGTRRGELKRFTLWETKTRFYLVAYNVSQTRFQILKVDRTPPVLIDEQTSTSAGGSANEPSSTEGSADKDKSGDPSSSNNGVSAGSATAGGGGAAATSNSQSPATNPSKPAAEFSTSGERYLSSDVSDVAQLCASTEAMLSRVAAAQTSTVFGGTASSGGTTSSTTAASSISGVGGDGKDGHGVSNTSAPASAFLSSVGSGWSGAASRILNPGSYLSSPSTPLAPAPPSEKSSGANASASGASASQPPPRKSKPGLQDYKCELNVTSDRVVYTRTQVNDLLSLLREGNRASGGLHEVGRFFGIVGFIRFTSTYYMVLISRRSVVALVGGHYIYHADEAKILPVCHPSVLSTLHSHRTKAQEQEEARLLHTFGQVDLSKNFYFSYTYDLTQTLQENLTADPSGPSAPPRHTTAWGFAEKFVWNHYLLMPAFGSSAHSGNSHGREWVLPLVYGFVDQAKLSVLSRTVHVTLIARRSRHFAGARFLKRGVNERGQVANDVETEQIVAEATTTPFFAPGRRRRSRSGRQGRRKVERMKTRLGSDSAVDGNNSDASERSEDDEDEDTYHYDSSPRFTSYVMHRGSIPLSWTQDSTNMSPRPPIELSVVDPYFSPAAQHFNEMFSRYGTPVLVLNLIKSKEKSPREEKLGKAFAECIQYLNQFLPSEKRIKYIAWDMSRASKSRDQDVIGVLEDIAEETVESTKFFHSGPESHQNTLLLEDQEECDSDGFSTSQDRFKKIESRRRTHILLQQGIARVNCVDCLDRTNAAQFVIGKAAFGHQLHALGLLHHPDLPFDCDAVNMLTEMYHDLGDTIALQYGGSHLVNTMETYRKINQWTSHSRDMLEGLKRYYSNSFVDADKQMAINLFLGIRPDAPDISPDAPVPEEGEDGRDRKEKQNALVRRNGSSRPHYCNWFVPAYLNPRGTLRQREKRLREVVNNDTGFWAEYYRPRLFTDLMRHHAFKMTAVHQHPSGVLPSGPSVTSNSSSGHSRSPSLSTFGLPSASTLGFSSSTPSSSATSIPTISDWTELSPFQPRYAPGTQPPPPARRNRPSRHGRSGSSTSDILSTNAGQLPPSLSPSDAPPGAIIGGVRRWMSLNRPGSGRGNPDSTPAGGNSQLRKKSKRYDEGSASGVGGSLMKHGEASNAQSSNPNQSSASALESLVKRLLSPQVNSEEAAEYQWYSSQFAPDENESSLTEDTAELTLSTAYPLNLPPRSRPVGSAGTGARGVSLTSAGAWATSTEGVSDSDLALYEAGVALSSGDFERVGELVAGDEAFDQNLVTVYANAVSIKNAALNPSVLNGNNQNVKMKAYANWLSLGMVR